MLIYSSVVLIMVPQCSPYRPYRLHPLPLEFVRRTSVRHPRVGQVLCWQTLHLRNECEARMTQSDLNDSLSEPVVGRGARLRRFDLKNKRKTPPWQSSSLHELARGGNALQVNYTTLGDTHTRREECSGRHRQGTPHCTAPYCTASYFAVRCTPTLCVYNDDSLSQDSG